MSNFVPSSEWQEVLPENEPLPPGLEIKMDLEAGKRFARLPQNGNGMHKEPQSQTIAAAKPKTKTRHELILNALKRGETGDAELFARYFSENVKYDHSEKRWYRWTGQHWEQDITGKVYYLVANRLAAYYLGAAAKARKAGDTDTEKKLIQRASELHDRRRVDNVLFLAARQSSIALTGEEWDSSPWLLAVENGVIDLRSGQFREGRPDDYIRSYAPVRWAGINVLAPMWEKFLHEIQAGDQETINFLQRLLGMAIVGTIRERVLSILHGEEGANGKTTLVETIGSVLGSKLATSSPADALMEIGRQNGNAPQPFVYSLRGKRFVFASESNEERRINSSMVKKLTGGDTIKVRTLNAEPVEFQPSHTVFLITNHKPQMPTDDQALWDRVLLIPFDCRFVDNPSAKNEYKKDPQLKEKLQAEASGILAWLVRGCLEWQKNGLNPPNSVKAATEKYSKEEDLLEQFIEEACTKKNPNAKLRASMFYNAYKNWAVSYGLNPISSTSFGKQMKKKLDWDKDGYVYYIGIDLIP